MEYLTVALAILLGYMGGRIRTNSIVRREVRNALETDKDMFNEQAMRHITALENYLNVEYKVKPSEPTYTKIKPRKSK